MKLRRNFLPKNLADWTSFIFIAIVIPLFYWFEMFFVLQRFYSFDSTWYWIHLFMGSFIMMNIVGNLLAVMFIDTSVFSVDLNRFSKKGTNWSYCDKCQSPTPPRCWHCDLCDRCILKRDHHCTFSGCCIGHYNHRFFLMFLLYFFSACYYALYLNLFFILPRISYDSLLFFQIFAPFMLLMFDFRKAETHLLMIFLVLNVVGIVISSILVRFHLRLLYNGTVSYENSRCIRKYDCGLKQNIKNIFGERWYLTWVSPFIYSAEVLDGINWITENTLQKTKVM